MTCGCITACRWPDCLTEEEHQELGRELAAEYLSPIDLLADRRLNELREERPG
jgi:hypothetical protein